jgi:protein SCO1/2
MLMLGACSRSTDAPAGASAPVAAASPQRHPLTGEIVKVDAEKRMLTVAHDKIPGFMPAMTMEFTVGEGDARNARPGQRIRAQLVMRSDEPWLEQIWPDDTQTRGTLDAAARALQQDTMIRGRAAYREIGEELPEFTLLDQEGRTVSIGRFRGRQVVMNFIYVRCPIGTMCPAATLRMMALQRAARAAGVTDLELISVSFDPEDTPGVLKEYAAARQIDTENFSFLTGPPAAVDSLLRQMGVLRELEGGTYKHTLATLLIGTDGRIIHRTDGSQWDVDEFVKRLRKG